MKRLVCTSVICVFLLLLAGTSFATQVTLAIPQAWQHKDTNMWCNVCGAGVIHAWNHATQCNHCGMYCGPGACSMYASFMGRGIPFTNQDDIYDNGKSAQGEILGNGILETDGVGMYVGLGGWPAEVQQAFTYAVGLQPFQHGPVASGFPLITPGIVKWYLDHNLPILWVDIGIWPSDQENIPAQLYYESGHCKIIAGYNDNDTPGNFNDDSYLIFDPWPTSGSPYWVALNLVIDPADIYLATMQPFATERESWGSIKNGFVR
jgi:hypothetical protein